MTSKISWISIFILTLHTPRFLHARSRPNAQAQLIHEFARSFKHIHRVSLLSCHNLPVNCDFYRTPNQTTSPTSTTTNAIINSLTFVESLFKAEGILIKVLAIDTLSASWSTTSSRMELLKSFLQSEDHRQVVVLNLSCGNNSLEILELVSNHKDKLRKTLYASQSFFRQIRYPAETAGISPCAIYIQPNIFRPQCNIMCVSAFY